MKIKDKKPWLLSIILFLCFWDALLSMEERESKTADVISEESSPSNETQVKTFKFLIGGEKFEVSWDIVQHIKAIKAMIEDLEKSEEATEIDELFPDPKAVKENQRNFKIIIALLSNQEHGYSYTMEDHISLLNCANKLDVEVVLKVGTAMLADHIDTVEEIDDELLSQLKNLNHHVFFQVCSQLKFIKPVLLDTLPISKFGFIINPCFIKHISFNRNKTKVAFAFGRGIYMFDLAQKNIEKIFSLDREEIIDPNPYKALKFTQDDKELIAFIDNKLLRCNLENKQIVRESIPSDIYEMILWCMKNEAITCDNVIFNSVLKGYKFCKNDKFLGYVTEKYLHLMPFKRMSKPKKKWLLNPEQWKKIKELVLPIKAFKITFPEDFIDSKMKALHFNPTKQLLVIKVEKKRFLSRFVNKSVYIWNLRIGSFEKILDRDCLVSDIKFDSSGSNLYIACGREGVYRFNMHTKTLTQLLNGNDCGYCCYSFDISNDDKLISIGTKERVILYKHGAAVAKQITNLDELCFLKKMERLRSEDKKLALCRHNNPEMYATYQGANFASALSKTVQAGCSLNCYLQDVKQIVKKPLVIAGAAGAVALAGYVAYKKWFRG